VQFQHLEGNLFTVQCFCLGDWLKVEKGGPWLFRQAVVCIEEYDGLAAPDSIDLNFFSTWIQIHKLPAGYRKKALVTNLIEKKVGKVIDVELNVNGAGNFVRFQVKLDIRNPLARFVSMSRGGQREVYQIKYEKMSCFCGACGMIGHSHLECGTGESDENKLKWGDWLKADWDTWHGRDFGGARGGSHADRGGRDGGYGRDPGFGQGNDVAGCGDGAWQSWRYNAIQRPEDVLVDTSSSLPKKGDHISEDRESFESAAKRRLSLGFTNPIFEDEVENRKTPMITDGEPTTLDDLNGDTTVDRTKRSKKDGANSPSLGSAGSFEGSVWSQ
jgi:hypothetical protein